MADPTCKDFEIGQRVTYVPNHADGNAQHPDCERGVVTSINDSINTVFVRFGADYYSKGCYPHNLVKG